MNIYWEKCSKCRTEPEMSVLRLSKILISPQRSPLGLENWFSSAENLQKLSQKVLWWIQCRKTP